MKIRLTLMVLTLTLGVAAMAPAAAPPSSCESFCYIVRCLPGYICGPYINSAGEPACGCHPSGPKG
jgi:hypothetical protein